MRIIKYTLMLFIFILPASVMASTTGKIAGIIKDASTGEPLPGVNVVVEGTMLGAASDLDGFYVILNIPPGQYTLNVSMVGYATAIVREVRVNIDQTTSIDIDLREETLESGETITVVAQRPVIERDVAASRANLSSEEIKNIPVVAVSNVIGLQAGIEGLEIRGGGLDQVAFMVDGITLRDERDNTPYTAISFTSVEEIQIQAGGFNAEYGNIRSGIVNFVTKEGKRDRYNFAFLGRYSPATPKHFGHSPNSPDSYWIRPYVDPEVCWTGTKNGAWDLHTQAQYPEFKGWNKISEETLSNDDPNDDLTPEAAQQVFLWQHRRQLDIAGPDYSADLSLGGPVPLVSQALGGLRFHTSLRRTQTMYLIPLYDDAYRDFTYQLKLTSDVGKGKKLMFDGLLGRETGVDRWNNGTPGMFTADWQIASALSNGPKYIDARMFATDYWGPAQTDYRSAAIKYSHVLNDMTFYEGSMHVFQSEYHKGTGRPRDKETLYKFGNNYYVDEAPFGFDPNSTAGIDGMRMGAGMSNARDSSLVTTFSFKFDFTRQLDQRNNLKTGAEFIVSRSQINYARYDQFLPSGNVQTKWDRTPLRGALYVQDKLEFEGMIAQMGLRMDYSHAGGKWYVYDPFDRALSSAFAAGIDTILEKKPTKHLFTFSPRLAIAFPISENSKIYFNYGHFRQMPEPESLYLIRTLPYTGQIDRMADPNRELPRTIAYELGYEHNIYDQFLIRAAGYYKDIALQPRQVRYENLDGSVSYNRFEPNSYEDIRGFEITLNKNRGNWVRGFVNYTYMVNTYGYFGNRLNYENPAQQRLEEQTSTDHYQRRPKPRPYARANIDFFTPVQYGPKIAGTYPLADWRLNFLGNWKTGSYTSWIGGGSTGDIQYNLQWKDYVNVDIRLSKSFRLLDKANVEFFIDVNNVFNYKNLTSYGFVDYDDMRRYYQSLHFPANTKGIDRFSYVNIPGKDKLGEYRKPGVDFVPIIARQNYMALGAAEKNGNDLYYFVNAVNGVHGAGYYRYDEANNLWYEEDQRRVNKILKDKAYIDMPNLQYLTFLDRRNVFWGLRLSFEL